LRQEPILPFKCIFLLSSAPSDEEFAAADISVKTVEAVFCISAQSFFISFSFVRAEVTVNRITYLPFSEAGTQWILPEI